MNRKQLNLDLTVGLVNQLPKRNSLKTVREIVGRAEDAGKLISESLVEQQLIGGTWTNQTFSLQYENCTVKVDLISDKKTKSEIVKGFQLK